MSEARPASCMPGACFCEEIRESGIRQPANSLSSLAFVLVALLVIARARNKALGVLFAITLTIVGIGSAYFHATLSFNGQFFDVLGMYLVATLALILSYDKVRSLSRARMMSAFFGINVILATVLYFAPVYRRWIFAALLGAIIGLEVKDAGGSRPHLWQAVLVMAIAFVIWALDFTRVLCSPSSLIQGHAVWHLLGAAAAWLLFLHYESHVTRIRK